MSLLPALGARQYQTSSLANPATPAGGGKNAGGAAALMGRTGKDAVSLSQNGIDLSAQGMAERTDALGNATIDVAQNFLNSFTQSLLGDAAKGATVSFDSASVSAEAGFSGAIQHSRGAKGSSDSAAFSLNESSHFIGKGKITTADGQSFDFEIEVQYESRLSAAASSSSGADNGAQAADAAQSGDAAKPGGDAQPTPTAQLPDQHFPGGLDDLFRLLGRQLQADVPDPAAAPGAEKAGTLTLRMLNLIRQPSVLDAAPNAPTADEAARAKALAKAYGGAPTAPADALAPLVAASAAGTPAVDTPAAGTPLKASA
ncbi:hypothetical protein [Janthinobacterium sp.]|uniref:hypothetical protein n=1 Tax=Janthinobacterium sp. TaxID=1871054 RepID=UPI00293D7937|nr:hypothetical protein [Janthinobacterium sp.]